MATMAYGCNRNSGMRATPFNVQGGREVLIPYVEGALADGHHRFAAFEGVVFTEQVF